MQTLNRLIQIARAAATLGDLAREKSVHMLPATPQGTVYIHAEDAAVRVVRWDREQVEATIELSPPLAWRTATDYDDNGAYLVLAKRPGFGSLAKATLSVVVPRQAHLTLRLENGLVSLDHVRGTLHVPPPTDTPTPPALDDGIHKSQS